MCAVEVANLSDGVELLGEGPRPDPTQVCFEL